ncbi:HAD family hydrolase [Paenisporosarcina indica]|uniref:HAD family hydrolase n=1 Tax=Paenisporosarcina indica TaxID=650093 RepID=UPI00094FA177|nr:HAD family hydrolase [Paenisporosarcina indica]
MIKAIIFDFDGTLANTLPICFDAFQHVFKEFDNTELNSEEIKSMFGPSETGIIRENLLNINKDEAIELYYKIYSEHHNRLVTSNSDINDLLQYLKDTGIKMGIFTGKARRSLDISLKALQMEGMFDVIITGDDVTMPKPNPEGLIKSLSLLGIDNSEAIFVGDSDADMYAGIQANVYTIGVQWLPDFHSLEFTIEPNTIVKSVNEFMDALKVGVST